MNKGSVDYSETVVIIPTRNRSGIAMNAIRSVLDQPVSSIQLMVSDNSTSERDRDALAAFCSSLSDVRLRYLRPPQSLSMSAHWDWAIQQALEFYQASHFLYLTDRMMFKTSALKELLDLASVYSDQVITYNLDRIVDHQRPIRIEQYPATGKLLSVETVHFSWLFSQSIFHPGLPRMLNCIVPREVLERMRQRFGNVFSSIAPDFNFCFRCLDVEDKILFFDKSLLFHYALNRSNGASVTRGEMTADNADFTANLPIDNSIRNYATPIPQLNTAVNAAFNEYFIYKQESMSSRFFEPDSQKYLACNAMEILQVSDPQLKREMSALLEKHGYREGTSSESLASSTTWTKKLRLSNVRNKVKRTFKRVSSGAATKQVWWFLASRLGIRPPGEVGFEFWDLDEAIYYIRSVSHGNLTHWSGVVELLKGIELPLRRR